MAVLTAAVVAQDSAAHPTAEAGKPAAAGFQLPEAEFVMSPSFRTATLVQPVWSNLNAEGHYFGGDKNNIGFAGGDWKFHSEHWKIAPGVGVLFGDNSFRTMPALSLRWGYERGWFVTEGLLVQGLLHTTFTEDRGTKEAVIPSIADGNHASARWKRITAGGTWEHIHFREGTEWKGGTRVAYRILPRCSLMFFALWPNTEVRGGILFQPEEGK